MSSSTNPPVEAILQLYQERGNSEYGGECVTQLEHALQAAHFAQQTGASPELITAALLHDVGHLLHDLPEDAPDQGVDDRHEDRAVPWLTRWFGPAVTEPIRMHVAAKRYLFTAEPEYRKHLSEPSLTSLHLQGGAMSAAEMASFESSPHFEAAVLLRRWDDAAKIADLSVPGIETYTAQIAAAAANSTSERPAP